MSGSTAASDTTAAAAAGTLAAAGAAPAAPATAISIPLWCDAVLYSSAYTCNTAASAAFLLSLKAS